SRAANFVLGLSELQMNKGDQLHRLEELGVFNVDWLGPAKEAIKKDAMKKGLKEDKAGEFADSVCPAAGQRSPVESTLLNKGTEKSGLLKRVSMGEGGKMPPLARSVVDEKAVEMLREWIKSRKPKETQRAEN